MDRHEAVAVINVVCWRLGVQPPSEIAWGTKVRNGRYERLPNVRGHRGRLIVGPRPWRGALPCLLHELAHHVVAERRPRYSARERAFPGMRRKMVVLKASGWGVAGVRREAGVQHGPIFLETLREIVQLWYDDVDLYPWNTEYKSLRGRQPR